MVRSASFDVHCCFEPLNHEKAVFFYHADSNPSQERTKEILPTILEGTHDHNLRTVPEEKVSDASSDVDDNRSPQLIHRADNERDSLLSGGVKDDNELTRARLPIPILGERQEPQSPSPTATKLPFESDFYSASKVEEGKSKKSGPTPAEPKFSSPRSRSPSPVVTVQHYGNGFNLSTLKEVEKPRTPSPAIAQTHKSQSPSPIVIEPQNGNEYHALPLEESAGGDKSVVTSTHVTSKYHGDKESSRSSSLAEINTKERPDPIGGVATATGQQCDEERAKTDIREAEETTSEGGDSTDYSLDSARGDSLLPTVDENSYLGSQDHPRFVLMKPSEGSTVGRLR